MKQTQPYIASYIAKVDNLVFHRKKKKLVHPTSSLSRPIRTYHYKSCLKVHNSCSYPGTDLILCKSTGSTSCDEGMSSPVINKHTSGYYNQSKRLSTTLERNLLLILICITIVLLSNRELKET